jgi:hypothetical protein
VARRVYDYVNRVNETPKCDSRARVLRVFVFIELFCWLLAVFLLFIYFSLQCVRRVVELCACMK